MADVPITLAITDYEHVRDLVSGEVRTEGIDLTCLTYPAVREIFFRFFRYREWDVSELSMAKYVSLRASGDRSLTAIPVFPSRFFRHSAMLVRSDGPADPSGLAGARIGVPEWAETAGIYMRAILTHDYGVPLSAVHWYQAGREQAGRTEEASIRLPEGVELTKVTDRSLNEMLLANDLDAVFSAGPLSCLENGDQRVRRLFPNFVEVERAYAARKGIYPIMHVVVIRSDVLEEHPWIAMNLFSAFEEAKRRSVERFRSAGRSVMPVPWIAQYMEEISADLSEIFAGEWWPYGVEANRVTLEAFTTFAYEQGVAETKVDLDDLFAKETLTSFRA